MSTRRIRFLICGHDLKFINPLIRRLESQAEYELRILEHQGHVINDEKAAAQALQWADVIFCEWALGNAVWFSQRKRPDQTLVVRLHLQEVHDRDRISFIWQTDWGKVDRLVVITQHIYDWMRSEFPILASKCSLVYNPIAAETELNIPKSIDTRFVLGFVGLVPARKRIDVAVALLKQLRKVDSRYVLRVKGKLPSEIPWMASRTVEMQWYKQVFDDVSELIDEGVVILDPHGPDMASWYKNVGHILSVSDFEGSHQAVAEGMATGCVPAIRNWEGAERIYPTKYVSGTVEALAENIHKHSEEQAFVRESEYCRSFAQSRFDERLICERLEAIVAKELLGNPNSRVDSQIAKSVSAAMPTYMILAYIPIGSKGGYRIRVEQEIKILIQQGCKVHLTCLLPHIDRKRASRAKLAEFDASARKHKEEFKTFGCAVNLIEVDDIFRLNVDEECFFAAVQEIANSVTENAVDILHAEALYCARVGAQVKRIAPNVLFSIDWHGVIPEEARMGGAHEKRIEILEIAEVNLLTACDLNIFVSKQMRQHYQRKYGLNLLKHCTVPCCVSDERFASTATSGIDRVWSDEYLVFGYAGTMADWQCGAEMMAMFAQLHSSDDRCRFLMLVPKMDQEKVMAYAKQANLPSTAIFLTEVSHDEVPGRLLGCEVGVLLRTNDPVNRVSSPTKFGEYLAAGLPVVMTEGIGDFSEVAGSQEIGIVLGKDCLTENELTLSSSGIGALLTYAQRVKGNRTNVAGRCQWVARETLAWEPVANHWISICSQILGKGEV